MKALSKIVIAYDGSACSEAALHDLSRAGLPAGVEALVLTVADVFLPPADDELPDEPAIRIPEVERHARRRAEKAVKEARTYAERALNRVKADFPGWQVKAEVECDTPAWAVIKMADRLGADLIVIGSHGHASAGGRLIMGSVSQRVLYEARCSVRVARCSDERRAGPVRIVLGLSGSWDAEAAADAVAARAWPEGSEARVVTSHNTSPAAVQGIASERLRAAGLNTSSVSRDGDPAHVLLDEAEKWGADSVFLGTRDIHGMKHLLHGSVAAAVAARAGCSVEVVRPA